MRTTSARRHPKAKSCHEPSNTVCTRDHASRGPIVSALPLVLSAPDRGADLRIRVSAPSEGADLPIIVLAHGFGSSMLAYGPLADYWAAHGFVVIQPTFLDSRTMGLSADDERRAHLWRFRVDDMKRGLDNLDELEEAFPAIRGRLDRERIAVAGHSFGGQTAGILLGLRVDAPDGHPGEDLSDARVKAGVLLAAAGRGGDNLTAEAAQMFPWLNPDFSHLTQPALVVYGDADVNPFLTHRAADWMAEPYELAPGAEALVTLFGGVPSLGGIPGYEAAETTDENLDRVTAVQPLSLAFLRSRLYPGDLSWDRAKTDFEAHSSLGRIDTK